MYIISERFGNYGAEQCGFLIALNPEHVAILQANGTNFTAIDRNQMTGEEVQKVGCCILLY